MQQELVLVLQLLLVLLLVQPQMTRMGDYRHNIVGMRATILCSFKSRN